MNKVKFNIIEVRLFQITNNTNCIPHSFDLRSLVLNVSSVILNGASTRKHNRVELVKSGINSVAVDFQRATNEET